MSEVNSSKHGSLLGPSITGSLEKLSNMINISMRWFFAAHHMYWALCVASLNNDQKENLLFIRQSGGFSDVNWRFQNSF